MAQEAVHAADVAGRLHHWGRLWVGLGWGVGAVVLCQGGGGRPGGVGAQAAGAGAG